MAGFTARGNRAVTRRGFLVMGKIALIDNEFPCPACLEHQSSVLQRQVRTGFPEKVAFFRVGTVGREFRGLFARVYESHGRFEPVAAAHLDGSYPVLVGLLLFNEPGFGSLELVQ